MSQTCFAISFVALALTSGCAANSVGDRCASVVDCSAGERCVDGRCTAGRPDAAVVDAGTDALVAVDAGVDSGPEDAGMDAGPPLGPCGVDPCGIWRVGPASSTWQAWPLGDDTFAPATPIRAAFDLETTGLGYVVTDTTYHVLRLSDRAWIADGTLASLFPEAATDTLLVAYSVPSNHVNGDGLNEGVTLQSATAAYSYALRLADGTTRYESTITNFGTAWEAPLAPARDALRFTWLDVTNARSWASGSPRATCGADAETVAAYAAVGTASRTHVLEAGLCFEFVAAPTHAAFEPFGYEGAPDPSRIGGTFWNAGSLWAFVDTSVE